MTLVTALMLRERKHSECWIDRAFCVVAFIMRILRSSSRCIQL